MLFNPIKPHQSPNPLPMFSAYLNLSRPIRSPPPSQIYPPLHPRHLSVNFGINPPPRINPIKFVAPIAAMDDDSYEYFDEGYEVSGVYLWSSGDESDTDLVVNLSLDGDLPSRRERVVDQDSRLAATAHRFATLHRGHMNNRISGVMLNVGLISFFTLFLVFVDWCSWRMVRLPLEPFYLTRPFSLSAVLSACLGWLYVPLVDSMKIYKTVSKKGPIRNTKRAIPTLGGLFFIPIGITVARSLAGQHSIQVFGATVATVSFAAIGLLDDVLNCNNENNVLPEWIKLLLQVGVATWFAFWLDSSNILTPYSMKFVVPLPPPIGLVYLGKYYLFLTSFCFVAMANGVKLSDGLDGLAGGTAALSFIGMSVAVLAICPALAVFGASMAGACIGFLFHNKYRANVCMGGTGSLALGGALASMAACTGMFLPLSISSGVFILEMVSVAVQVVYLLGPRRNYLNTRRFFRVAPLHRLLLSYGLHESAIVTIVYVASCILASFAGYVGLISA